MPVVTIANPKGGSGKTTTATLLSTTLVHQGASVSLIDGDPNAPHKTWREGASSTTVNFLSAHNDTELLNLIDSERTQRHIVIVDCEGVANTMMSHAMMRADLVLIPMAPTQLDAKEAARAVVLVKNAERVLGRRISHRIVFTSTQARGATREQKEIIGALQRTGVPVVETQIYDRVAYQTVFSRRLTLYELDKASVSGLDMAIRNAEQFTDEIKAIIKDIVQERRAAA
jgi:chromosome partitioning protein